MKLRTRRRIYLREASVTLVLARLALRLIAPARIFAWVDRPPRRPTRFSNDEIDWVSWALETIAARRPANQCLACALAAHAMLRRRGIASRVCLAVAREDREVIAHAWVESGNGKFIGATGGQRFTRIAEFGLPRAFQISPQ
ncbi:MAG TPA: lasso peptide biosynthesis B2 protein [Pseudolabrys sp.]|jgi:hypothetical protein